MNESEGRNRLLVKRLEPEVARHHQLSETRLSDFESLPPSQTKSIPEFLQKSLQANALRVLSSWLASGNTEPFMLPRQAKT